MKLLPPQRPPFLRIFQSTKFSPDFEINSVPPVGVVFGDHANECSPQGPNLGLRRFQTSFSPEISLEKYGFAPQDLGASRRRAGFPPVRVEAVCLHNLVPAP